MLKWIKAIIFSALFLLSTYYFLYNFNLVLSNLDFLFSLDLESFTPFINLVLSIYVLTICFSLSTTLAPNLYTKLLLVAFAAVLPLAIFTDTTVQLYLSLGLVVVFLIGIYEIRNHIRSYFHFNPRLIFSSVLHSLVTLLCILITVAYFFSYQTHIAKVGFSIPKPFVDQLSELTINNISSQFGLDPGSIDNQVDQLEGLGLSKSEVAKLKKEVNAVDIKQQTKDTLSKELEKNLQGLIDPYVGYIPYIVSLLFFFTIHSLAGLGFFLVPIFLTIVFFFLRKTKLVKVVTQMQEVERLVLEEDKHLLRKKETASK